MKEFLNFTIIQTDIEWNNKLVNLNKYSNLLKKTGNTDIVIFPELFDTGFVTDVSIIEKSKNYWYEKLSSHNPFE